MSRKKHRRNSQKQKRKQKKSGQDFLKNNQQKNMLQVQKQVAVEALNLNSEIVASSTTISSTKRQNSVWDDIIMITEQFRKWLEEIRKKYPDLFDGVIRIFDIAITVLITFFPFLVAQKWILAFLLFIQVSLLLMLQWATLTNQKDRELEEQSNRLCINYETEIERIQEQLLSTEEEYDALIKDDNIEIRKKYENELNAQRMQLEKIVEFLYSISKRRETIIGRMAYQELKITRTEIVNYLNDTLSGLEKVLFGVYGHEICASIKLATPRGKLQTLARGSNNVNKRGGRAKVIAMDRKEIDISQNYAYQLIIEYGLSIFAESNLCDIKHKAKDQDGFFCEYGSRYTDLFNSTVILPIRSSEFENDQERFGIMGLLCIDCFYNIKEWGAVDGKIDSVLETIGYKIIADYVDNLSLLIRTFKNAMTIKNLD